MIQFGEEVCGNLEAGLKREWLETNGLGGFASSTLAGINTRRYHGLLTAATRPPVGRFVLLSKLEETLTIDGRRFELSANQYSGVVHPKGYQYLKQFRLDPFPVATYVVEGVEIERTVFMIHGENSTVIQYKVALAESVNSRRGPGSIRLEVRPLIAFRDYHSTTHENGALNPHVDASPALAIVAPYAGLPALHLAHDAHVLDPSGFWYRDFEYEVERERGLDYVEDLFSPLALTFEFDRRSEGAIIASTEPHDVTRAAEYRRNEIVRRKAIISATGFDKDLLRTLAAATDQYIAARGDQKTIIAGYHWFSDWGRDTMISLPGIALVTGRWDTAESILASFARYVDRGMLPNRFPDAGEEPEYNTVDATLWFFEAVRSLLKYSGDYEFVRDKLYHVLADIVAWHIRGTRYGIRVDEDALLAAGEEGVQLTWMDAKIGDWVVTLRTGKPVEIQALWYNALRVMEHLAGEFGDSADEKRYRRLATQARRSFNGLFWNEASGCLYDVVSVGRRDASIRPNQILAVSLPYTMLSQQRARSVIEVVERELLTPYGLRSLAPGDPEYIGRYEGDPRQRDSAYHQGTVWAWLMGPFITAYIRVKGRNRKTRQAVARWLEGFQGHLSEAGLGQVSEIFDGDPPHTPRGCIAQAWSVAELLRAAVEDAFEVKPAPRKRAETIKARPARQRG